MKISEYKNEEALELLADLIEPASEIFSDKKIVKMIQDGKANKMELVKRIIKGHKKSIMEILAILDGVPVNEYECNVFSLPFKLLEILNDEDLVAFLPRRGRRGQRMRVGLLRGI